MNQMDVNPCMYAIQYNILGETKLSKEDMFPNKIQIPNTDVWRVFVREKLFDDTKKRNLLESLVNEHKWKKNNEQKEGYWAIQ